MKHTISYREMTEKEAARFRKTGMSLVELLVLPFIPGGLIWVLGIFVTALVKWAVDSMGWAVPAWVLVLVAAGFVLVGIHQGWLFFQALRKNYAKCRKDRKELQMQVIHVVDSQIIEQEPHNSEGPLYYFGIGDGRILFFQGQWIYDDAVYGREFDENDEERREPFPARSFIVHRSPNAGEVFKIEPLGNRVDPDRRIPRKAGWVPGLGDSSLLEGELDDLENILQSYKRKKGGGGNRQRKAAGV